MLGDVVETGEELVHIVILGGDLRILDVQGPNEEVQMFQSVAEFGSPAEQSRVASEFFEPGHFHLYVTVFDANKLFHLRLEPDVGLGARAEVNSGYLRIQEKTIFRFSGAQHKAGRCFGHGLPYEACRKGHAPARRDGFFVLPDLGPMRLKELCRPLVVAPNSRVGQNA